MFVDVVDVADACVPNKIKWENANGNIYTHYFSVTLGSAFKYNLH